LLKGRVAHQEFLGGFRHPVLTELGQIGGIVLLHETEKMGETFGGRRISFDSQKGGNTQGSGRGIDSM
jgi:hypothetical protein